MRALAVLVGVLLLGCGDGGSGGGGVDASAGVDATPERTYTCSVTINQSAAGGHVLVIPSEDVNAGVFDETHLFEKTYDIQGSEDHSHTVKLNDPSYQALADHYHDPIGISVDSSFGGSPAHFHRIGIYCDWPN